MPIDFTEKAKRYQAIDEIIASGERLKWDEIVKIIKSKYKLKTSRNTFFRDIKDLEVKYKAPIDKDIETAGYFYTDPHYHLPRFYTDENAAKAAKLIKTLMDMVKNNPLYKEAQEVFESLSIETSNYSTEQIKINKTPDNDRIIFVGAPNKSVPAETWRILDKALRENLEITFFYQGWREPERKHRRVQPLQLIFDNGNWNLHGFDIVKHETRRYTLGEMTELELTKNVFALPKDYDFRKMTRGSFGCIAENKYFDFKIHLHDYATRYAKDRIWGENQKTEEDKENPGPYGDGIILSFKSNQLTSIERWVWQWGDCAIPLAPKELVEDWKERRERINKIKI